MVPLCMAAWWAVWMIGVSAGDSPSKEHDPRNELLPYQEPEVAPLFRVGSGARGLTASHPTGAAQQLLPELQVQARPDAHQGLQADQRVQWIATAVAGAFLILCVTAALRHMIPAGIPQISNNSRDFNYRVPPAWSPEMEATYSFSAYMTDISL